EYIGGGLVDRGRPRSGGGIRLRSCVNGQRVETGCAWRHDLLPFLFRPHSWQSRRASAKEIIALRGWKATTAFRLAGSRRATGGAVPCGHEEHAAPRPPG